MKIEIDNGERQLILLALAELSLSRPGFDHASNILAMKMDNVHLLRAVTYDDFRKFNKDRVVARFPETDRLLAETFSAEFSNES